MSLPGQPQGQVLSLQSPALSVPEEPDEQVLSLQAPASPVPGQPQKQVLSLKALASSLPGQPEEQVLSLQGPASSFPGQLEEQVLSLQAPALSVTKEREEQVLSLQALVSSVTEEPEEQVLFLQAPASPVPGQPQGQVLSLQAPASSSTSPFSPSYCSADLQRSLVLPNSSWCNQSASPLTAIQLCKLFSLPSTEGGQPLVIMHCLTVSSTCRWSLFVHGHEVKRNSCPALALIPEQLKPLDLIHLVNTIDCLHVCVGNPDDQFVKWLLQEGEYSSHKPTFLWLYLIHMHQ